MKDMHHIVAAVRFTAWALMLAKSLFMLQYLLLIDVKVPLRQQIPWFERRLRTFMAGMVLMPLGWAMHQIWWWLAEIGSGGGRHMVQSWLFENAIWTCVFYAMVFVGVVMMFSGWLEDRFGAMWPVVGAAAVAGLFFAGLVHAR